MTFLSHSSRRFVLVWKHPGDPDDQAVASLEQFFDQTPQGRVVERLRDAYVIEGNVEDLRKAFADHPHWHMAPERRLSPLAAAASPSFG